MPPLAKWQALAAHIRRQITDGTYGAGDRLPSTSQLCAEHGVSAIVVRQAMTVLRTEGWVTGLHGVGVFVADDPPIPKD